MIFYLDNDSNVIPENETGDFAVLGVYSIKLNITRFRDSVSGKERLSVEVFERGSLTEPYAVVTCKFYDLQKELLRLRDYGVVISRLASSRLKKQIEDSYYDITMKYQDDETDGDIDEDLPGILDIICEYIIGNDIESKTINGIELYNIPAVEFTALLNSSKYKHYRGADVRAKLRDTGCTVYAKDRTDNTVAINGDRVKVISIRADSPLIKEAFAYILDPAEDITGSNRNQSTQEKST